MLKRFQTIKINVFTFLTKEQDKTHPKNQKVSEMFNIG